MSIVCQRCHQLTGYELCEKCVNDLNMEQAQEEAEADAQYEEQLCQLRWEEFKQEQET